jgi:hypothetical protein
MPFDAQHIHAGVWAGSVGALTLLVIGWLTGCAAPAIPENRSTGAQLIGTSRQQLFTCAGTPLREIDVPTGTVVKYYKEAPMLEESHVGSKASKAGIHGGCWAHILLSGDRVTGVEYKPVPDTLKATDQCDDMFRACVQ